MAVIAAFSVDAEEFPIGTLAARAGCRIELDQIVPTGETPIPYIWVHDCDPTHFERHAEAIDPIEAIDRLDVVRDRTLYRIAWADSIASIVECLRAVDATIVRADGLDTWTFRLRFPDHSAVTAFHERCIDADIRLSPDRVHPLDEHMGATDLIDLSESQREVLRVALDLGYFEVPRAATLDDVAARLDISAQAASERLRRAMATVTTEVVSLEDADS